MYAVNLSESKLLNLPGRDVHVFVGTEKIYSQRMTFGMTEVPALSSMTPHTHEDKEEIIFVLEGYGEVEVGGCLEKLEPYTAVLFPIGMSHMVRNLGPSPMKFVFAFNPVNDFGLDKK
jgi:quercetin dioxygenase-like cupin family protein